MKLTMRILAILIAFVCALSAPNPVLFASALEETWFVEEESAEENSDAAGDTDAAKDPQDSSSAGEGMTAGETEMQVVLQEFSETPSDDLLTLATLVLRAYALLSTYPEAADVLPADLASLLDLDFSGALDVGDSGILLTWYSLASIGMPREEEATIFMAQFDAFFGRDSAQTGTEPLETTEITTATDAVISTTSETTAHATTTGLRATASTTATTRPRTTTTKSTTTRTTPTTAPTTTKSTTTRTTDATSVSSTTTRTTATTTTATTAGVTTTTASTTATIPTAITATTARTTLATTMTTATTAGVTTVPGGAWVSKSRYNGIDVSRWQGEIDWEKVADDGVEFAMIRAGYGKWSSNIDAQFAKNMENARAAGIACGAYWYSYAETTAEAETEANCFLNAIKGYQFEYPLAFDIEDEIHMNLTKAQVSAIIDAFCSVLEDAGYYVCVYSYGWFLSTMVNDTVLQTYDVWVAHTGVSTPSYSKTTYGIWQYSHTSSVDGITGNVDADYSYKCYPRIMQRAGLNGF